MLRLPYVRILYQSSSGQWVKVSERPALIQESVDGGKAQEMQRQAKVSGRWLREVWWYNGRDGYVRDFAITYPPDGSRGTFSS